MRIAVIGAGVAGLVAADRLARRHEVVLFEAEPRVGGHTHTVDVEARSGTLAVDTGFIVFNRRTYPRFVALLEELGVRAQPGDMSFSVRSDRRDFEYSGSGLNGLFSQRRHVASLRFHRMVRDILRFYREARELLTPGVEMTLDDYLRSRGYSEAFVADHLLPMAGAVWSANRHEAGRLPARFLVRFFEHHGFLEVGERPQWLTVVGGSREYVKALIGRFRGEVRRSCPVARVSRRAGSVQVVPRGQAAERFDHAVLACHADQALAMIDTPSAVERDVLGAFRFQANEVTLHTDAGVMPRLTRTWASWNYHLDDDGAPGARVTYWMNRLQALATSTQYFVTLNHSEAVRQDRVLARFTYHHPVFTVDAPAAQARHPELIGHCGLSYCGAYWLNGFHEDGVVSALRVCDRLEAAA